MAPWRPLVATWALCNHIVHIEQEMALAGLKILKYPHPFLVGLGSKIIMPVTFARVKQILTSLIACAERGWISVGHNYCSVNYSDSRGEGMIAFWPVAIARVNVSCPHPGLA